MKASFKTCFVFICMLIGVTLQAQVTVNTNNASIFPEFVGWGSGFPKPLEIRNDFNQPMTFHTNISERMRITSTGQVGIGTTTPAFRLTVRNNIDIITTAPNRGYRINGDVVLQNPGLWNTFVGRMAGTNNTGTGNTFVGDSTGNANTTGSNNTMVGSLSGTLNTTGQCNSFFGIQTGKENVSGDFNTFMGHGAGSVNTAGSSNTFIGNATGNFNDTGSENTLLGSNAQVDFGLTNATAIGANAAVLTDSTMVLGNTNVQVVIGRFDPISTHKFTIEQASPGNRQGMTISNGLMGGPQRTAQLFVSRRASVLDAMGNRNHLMLRTGSQNRLFITRNLGPNAGYVGIGGFTPGNQPEEMLHVEEFIRSNSLGAASTTGPLPNTDGIVIAAADGKLHTRINFTGQTGDFLRADGQWAAPPGGGGGVDQDWETDLSGNVFTGFLAAGFPDMQVGNVGIGRIPDQNVKFHVKSLSTNLSNDVMAIETQTGDRVFRVGNAGNVGIGTQPSNAITGARVRVLTNDNTTTTDGLAVFNSDGDDLFKLKNKGLAGLGTGNPQAALHILQHEPVNMGLRMENSHSGRIMEFKVFGTDPSINPPQLIKGATIEFTDGNPRVIMAFTKPPGPGTPKVGVNTAAPQFELEVNGNIHASGMITSSDSRYKTQPDTIDAPITKIRQLEGIYYHWDTPSYPDKEFGSGRQIGMIAQDVEPILPEVVNVDDNGFYAMDYSRMVPLLLEGIKDQQDKIERFEQTVSDLQQIVADQQQQIDDLLAYHGSGSSEDWMKRQNQSPGIHSPSPTQSSLQQNQPNPFQNSTRIAYQLEKAGQVELSIYNLQGRKVKALFNGYQESGNYALNWAPANLPAGQYLYTLRLDGLPLTKRAILLR